MHILVVAVAMDSYLLFVSMNVSVPLNSHVCMFDLSAPEFTIMHTLIAKANTGKVTSNMPTRLHPYQCHHVSSSMMLKHTFLRVQRDILLFLAQVFASPLLPKLHRNLRRLRSRRRVCLPVRLQRLNVQLVFQSGCPPALVRHRDHLRRKMGLLQLRSRCIPVVLVCVLAFVALVLAERRFLFVHPLK